RTRAASSSTRNDSTRRTASSCPRRNPSAEPRTSEAAAIATSGIGRLLPHLQVHDIVDGRIAGQAAALGVGIELDAGDGAGRQPRGARPARQLRGADEPLVL